MKKELTRLSKLLSYVLRHHPDHIGIAMDSNGWVLVTELLDRLKASGHEVDSALLDEIVASNSKKRFAFNADRTMIRASQGHSIDVDLGIAAAEPPAVLYHGTAEKNRASIMKEGLKKQQRQHVHLSDNLQTAREVGQRHGVPVIFYVDTARMLKDGYSFFLSENKVWLTDEVPAQYLSGGE